MADYTELWGQPMHRLLCESCGQVYLSTNKERSYTCPDCLESTLKSEEHAEIEQAALQPELVIPFSISAEAVDKALTSFANQYRFTPLDFTISNLRQRMQPVYLPLYLVDCTVTATWQAEIGFEEHAAPYGRQSDVTWDARAGKINRHYDNIRVPAMSNHANSVQPLGKFKSWHALPYEPDQIGEALIHLPDRQIDEAWPEAEIAITHKSMHDCSIAAGGRYSRTFSWDSAFSKQHWTKLLLPVYTTWYIGDDGKRVVLQVNGDSGQVIGTQVASYKLALRTTAMIALMALVVFALYLFSFFWGSGGFSTLLLPIAALLAFATLLPLLYVYSVNRE